MHGDDLAEMQRLKATIGQLEQELAEVGGSIKTLSKHIQELGFKSLNSTKAELPKLAKQLKELQDEFHAKLREFYDKHDQAFEDHA